MLFFNLVLAVTYFVQYKTLRSDLFRSNLIENPICSCGVSPETAEHYFLYCTKYVTARTKLKNNEVVSRRPGKLKDFLF
jgi:hypothetical protein